MKAVAKINLNLNYILMGSFSKPGIKLSVEDWGKGREYVPFSVNLGQYFEITGTQGTFF